MFEDAIPISETANRSLQLPDIIFLGIIDGHRFKGIAKLHSISANILDRRSPHRAGYQSKILNPTKTGRCRVENGFVPVLARLQNQRRLVAADPLPPAASHGHDQHQTIKVTGKHQVASAAQNQCAHTTVTGPLHCCQ